MEVKNWLNAARFPVKGEVNRRPSLTVPDETLSIREIIDRHARGIPTRSSVFVPEFDEEDHDPNPLRMDISERAEYAQKLTSELEELKSTDAKRKAEIAAKKAEEKRLADEDRALLDSLKKKGDDKSPTNTNTP